jgi:hypothetical protein
MYESERRWGPFSLAIAIAGGLVIGGILLSVALWVLGMLAGVVFFVLRIALLVGLAAAVIYGVRWFLGDRSRVDR